MKLGIPDHTIELIRSFDQGMKARIWLNGTLSEETEVNNGLRQGCCLAPVLFNLYASLVAERWAARVCELEGVGVNLQFKLDGKLFKRCTRNTTD